MCTICGATKMDENFVSIFQNSLDRGRDYSNVFYRNGSWICNHRAVPTTEIENAEFNQPFGTDYKVVHNGTISNDKELGNPEGMIDSYILSKVLDFTNLTTLRDSLQKIVGSYAIGIMKPNGTFYLACNYKPIFYSYHEGEFYFSSYRNHLPADWNVVHMKPYSVFDSETGESLDIPRTVFDHCIVIASGGLDSTAVAAYACHKHKKVTLLHFNYGCIAEDRELELIKKISEELSSRNPECDVTLDVVNLDLPFMKNASTLFGSNDDIMEGIAGSEYAHEWVPARNLMMMSIAVAYAESKDASYIYLGTNLEEGGAYPDNENQFIKDLDNCLYGAVQNGKYVHIDTPVGNLMKHEIVKFGLKYNAPFEYTWSCYRDGEKACGHCGPCFMRQTAFQRNGMVDPIQYEKPKVKYESNNN